MRNGLRKVRREGGIIGGCKASLVSTLLRCKIPIWSSAFCGVCSVRQGEGGGSNERTISGVETLPLQVALPPPHPQVPF